MTKIYNTKKELMFEDKNLSLRELAEKNKKNLKYANLSGADLRFADLKEANLRGASFDCLTIFPNGKTAEQLLNKGE